MPSPRARPTSRIALGVEKLKDTGYGGLPGGRGGPLQALWSANGTAPGNFAQLATAYMTAHGVSGEDLKKAIGHVSWKSHQNGAKNPKAHLQKAVEMDTILNAPMIASPLGLFDCCGVSDGAAAAIVTTPEIAKAMGKQNIVAVKALQLSVSNGSESGHNSWDGSYFHTTRIASKKAYEEAGIKDPREEVSMFEVHDCFSVTELVTMEDLHISETGEGWKDVLDGFYDADGKIPCQIDGGLKCFGHPIGASGLRMLYEMYLQFQGRAGARQLKDPTHRHDPQSRRRAARERVERRHRRPLRVIVELNDPLSARSERGFFIPGGRRAAMQLDKKLIGHEFKAFSAIVEAGKLKLFCKAIGEEDPIYPTRRPPRRRATARSPCRRPSCRRCTNDDPEKGGLLQAAQRRYRPDPAWRAALRLSRAGLRRRQDHLPAEGRRHLRQEGRRPVVRRLRDLDEGPGGQAGGQGARASPSCATPTPAKK